VASHRRPKQPNRARVTVLTAAAATAVALSAQAGAQAAPKLTLSQATKEVAADRQAADAAGQKYDSAQSQEQTLQSQVSLLQDEIAREQGTVNQEESTLGAEAAAQYRTGVVDASVQMMLSSNPTAYLNQASLQGELDSSQEAVFADIKGQQQLLDRQKAQATEELASEQSLLKQMQQTKSSAQTKLKQAQSIVASLTPVQQTQVNTGGGYGALDGDHNGSTESVSQVLSQLSGISSQAQTAMRAALSKVGIAPYQWAGAGPDAFDCSGLVMWAYAQANISLPHSSYSDESVGSYVSPSDIQVGDIVVLENGAHVGLYAGNGMVVNAPEYGYTVSIMPISDFGGIVAVRRV
jgi:cell wall-associated NlpC family hydrolase